MRSFSGARLVLFLLVVTIECCLFFGADCDLEWRQDGAGSSIQVGRLNKTRATNELDRTVSRIIPKGGNGSIQRVHSRIHLRDGHQLKRSRTASNHLATIKRTVVIVKRSAQAGFSSRRKQPKIHLAQRPRGSATTSTTSTSTTSTTSPSSEDTEEESSSASSKAEEPAESGEIGEDSGEYEEIEEDESTTQAEVEGDKSATSTTAKTPPKSTGYEAKTPGGKASKTPGGESKPQKVPTKAKDELKKSRTSANQTSDAENSSMASKMRSKKPLMALPFIKPKNSSICIPEAYLEFPRDLIRTKWRGRGLILIHIAVVCYMFYSLALVCERYFMPSLEEFAQRLQLSEDVAGATLMSAGSSAPELFTAILGVFIAKGDIGTGTIVGSAVFNILFVIGVCAFVSTTTAQLNWWPVLRDSVFYSFTVLVLILCIYDERVTAMESFAMLALYGVYILIMVHNESVKECVTRNLLAYPVTANLISSAMSVEGPDDVFGSPGAATSSNVQDSGANSDKRSFFSGGGGQSAASNRNYQTTSMIVHHHSQRTVEEDSMCLAACLIIVRHKRLFKSQLRFQSAARYIIIKRQHKIQQHQLKQQQQQKSYQSSEVNYFGPEDEPLKSNQRNRMEAYARSASIPKNKFSIVSKDDYEFWNRPPEEGENYYLWLAKIPVNYVLHYTVPDCSLYPDKYIFTFVVSILWTALFSYIMVWMVTLIGYTLGIPDSVMGATFLAAGTSVPDCYSSIHAARNGMADMAVSNSIGSNVFDILVGLSLPWFIQTAIYPGVVATINSRGVIYSVVLLFLSLIVTIYLLNKYEWTLKPRLGLALLIAYGLFIVLSCMLEFNLFGHVNPPSCPAD